MKTQARMKHTFIFFYLTIFLFFNASFSSAGNDYELFSDHGQQGLKNDEGSVVIPAKYESLGWTRGKLQVVNNTIGYKTPEGWGLISLANEIITPPEYTQIYPSRGQLLIAARKGKISQRDFLGVISTSGKVVLYFKYASIDVSDLRAIVSNKSGNKYQYGVVDLGGKEVIPIEYNEIVPLGNLRFGVRNTDGKMAIYNDKGKQVVGFELDSISNFKSGYAVVFENHLRGLINSSGILVAPVESRDFDVTGSTPKKVGFDEWHILDEQNQKDQQTLRADKVIPIDSHTWQLVANNKTWLIDSTGAMVTLGTYDDLLSIQSEMYAFKKGSQWGVMKKNSEVILPAKFDSVYFNKEMLYCREHISSVNKWSLYDAHGIKKSVQLYDAIGEETSYLYPVKKGEYWGCINRQGEEVIHCVYDEIQPAVDGLLAVKFHGEYGVIDKQGRWVVFPQKKFLKVINDKFYLELDRALTNLKSFEEGTIYFTENKVEVFDSYLVEHLSDGGVWKVDFSGRILNKSATNDRYEEVRAPSEGYYPVKINGQYGFVDNQNRLRIANRYDDVGNFKEGFAAIKLIGHWGFIDKRERIVVQPLYSSVSEFMDGLAIVSTEKGFGLIEYNGDKVSAFDYDSIYHEANGRYVVLKGDKKGLINKQGRLIVNPKYDELVDVGNGHVIVKKFGKYGVLDLNGVDVIPLMYDQLTYDNTKSCYLAMKKSGWKDIQIP